MEREYTNGEVTVVWKPKLCFHSKKCWMGLPAVFNTEQKPWIQPDKATTDEIVKQVDQCPSSALSYYMNSGRQPDEMGEVRVQALPNGPLVVHGNLEVTTADGSSEKRTIKSSFCRCGESSKKPFCDGTHAKIGFKG